jgi:hypothetical protein
MIITGTCDEAVKAGKIREHRLDGIELADNGTQHDRTDFVFPSHAQVKFVAVPPDTLSRALSLPRSALAG